MPGFCFSVSAEAVARLFRGEGLLANCEENPRYNNQDQDWGCQQSQIAPNLNSIPGWTHPRPHGKSCSFCLPIWKPANLGCIPIWLRTNLSLALICRCRNLGKSNTPETPLDWQPGS